MRLTSIRLRNFLGFGEPGTTLEDLGPREIILGANGSGKSSVLHAIEFVGKAFKRQIIDGRAYIHRADFTRSLEVEIGVEFEAEDLRGLATILTYGITLEQSQMNPQWRPSQQVLNRYVRAALSEQPRFFDRFFAEQKVLLRVASVPGIGQSLQPRVEFRSANGSLYFGANGVLTRAEGELTGWGGFDLEREILEEVELSAHGILSNQPLDLSRIANSIAVEARKWTPDRLFDRLGPGEALPTALRIEGFPTFADHPSIDGGDLALIELRTLLSERGYSDPNISFFNALSTIYNSSFVSLSDSRARPEKIPIQALGAAIEYVPQVTGRDLSLLLFFLKNSWSDLGRSRFVEIQGAFESLTRFRFDIVLNPEQEVEPSPAPPSGARQGGDLGPSQTPTTVPVLRHYPYIVFEESGYSFLVDFAASGFFEILLVLSATLGPSKAVILLDEPVLNLHPSKQRELYAFLSKKASERGNQLFIITHSSTFVSIDDLAKAIRFSRGATGPVVRRLQFKSEWEQAQARKDLDRTPRMLEALFARSVVLVEGGGEAAALPLWFDKCPGGATIGEKGALFIDAGSDTHFGALIRILEAWGLPYRVIADSKATERVKRFGEAAIVYPFEDFSELLKSADLEGLKKTVTEVGGSGGDKDPAVARVLASRIPPPPPVIALWEQIRPFIESN